MTPGVRILYLLRAEESRPPANVLRAAGSIHLLRAGSFPDSSTYEYAPQIICIHGPFDHDARIALENLSGFHLPVLGIGGDNAEGLTAQVSEAISIEDLRSVLDLMASATSAPTTETTICHAEDKGHCLGRVVDDLVRLLEHLLSLRFPDFRERSERVFDASLWIGNHLCLPPSELKDLLRAARLREIGKLGLPDYIVEARRYERTAEEQTAYDRYPEFGARVLSELPSFRSLAKTVEFQLENFDGSGPAGLMAHQIPLGSRILRVAAAFGSITMSGDNHELAAHAAIAELERGRSSLYDPLLVKLVTNFHQCRKDAMTHNATRWVRVTELAEGMVLAEDIWSRTGMKIIPSGTCLTERILRVVHQFPLDSALESVQILK